MTPAEIAKLPVGTEVYVRVKLASTDTRDGFFRGDIAGQVGFLSRYYNAASIECVAPPKPAPLKVGERIFHKQGVWGVPGELLEIFRGYAIVKFPGCAELGFGPLTDYIRAPADTDASPATTTRH